MTGTSVAERGLGAESAPRASGGRRGRRLQPLGLPWIVPALVLCVGLIYYCIWYTAVISTWDWDGIDPNPERVGAENYIRIAQDPIFWKTIEPASYHCRARSVANGSKHKCADSAPWSVFFAGTNGRACLGQLSDMQAVEGKHAVQCRKR